MTCNSSSGVQCATCLTPSNYVQSGNQCICKENYYYDPALIDCLQCPIECEGCVLNGLVVECLACSTSIIPAHARKAFADSKYCSCQDRYYPTYNALQCNSCFSACLTCTDAQNTSCLSCDSNNDYRTFDSSTGKCDCSATYNESSPVAQKCVIPCYVACQTCSGAGSSACNSCDSTKNRELKSGYCTCKQGYFEYNPIQAGCQSCHYSCLTCSGSNTQCDSCGPNRTFISRQCPCDSGYYDNGLASCGSCDKTCSTCQAGGTANDCQSCDATKFRKQNGSKCDCIDLYSELNPKQDYCHQCHYSCLTCTDLTSNGCQTCDSSKKRTLQNSTQCLCDDGFYDDTINSLCAACHVSCKTCSGPLENQCILCDSTNNRTFDGGKCVCLTKFLESKPVQAACASCHYSCLTCSNSDTQCDSCDPNDKRSYVISTATCPCDNRYYDNGIALCSSCDQTCQFCTGGAPTNCKTCNELNFRQLNGSSCDCMNTYMEFSPVKSNCFKCDQTCKTCSGTASNQCLQCDSTQHRSLKNVSYCLCDDGYYDSNGCLNCHPSCLTCSGADQNNCLTCSSLDYRIKSASACNCMSDYVEFNPPQKKCQYILPCHYSCLTCSGGTSNDCLTCDSSVQREFIGTSCLCKSGYFDNNVKQCSTCDITCKTCQGPSSTNCLGCDDTRTLTSTSCPCRDNYINYIEFTPLQKTCKYIGTCHYSCLTCTGPNRDQCDTCASTNKRVKDANNNCICLDGFYDDQMSQACQSCHITCSTCSDGNDNNCMSCNSANSRIFNSATSKCDCMTNYSEFTTQIDKCQYNTCDYSCKTCLGPNKNDCYACDSRAYRSLQGSQCICRDGFYDQNNVSICQPCNYTCKTCNTNSSCLTCDSTEWRYLSTSQCICFDNYYDDAVAGQCVRCTNPKCKSCDKDTQQCLDCFQSRNQELDSSGNCVCKQNYLEIAPSLICKKQCNNNCQTCETNNPDKCLSCNQNSLLSLNLSSNKCECPDTYYYTESTMQCNRCISNCRLCTEQTALLCDQCNQNFIFDSIQQICVRYQIPSNYTQETIDTVKRVVKMSSQISIGVSSGSSLVMSIVSPNANFLQQFLSIQKLNFLLLINIPFPEILYEFCKSISGTNPLYLLQSINIFPQIIKEQDQEYNGSFNEGKFKQEKIKASIIYNVGGILIIVLANLLLFIPAVIMHNRRKQILKQLAIDYQLCTGLYLAASSQLSQIPKQSIFEKILNKILGIFSLQVHELLSIVLTFSITLQIFQFVYQGMDPEWDILAIKAIFICILLIYSIASFFFYVRFINNYSNNKKNEDLLSPISLKEFNRDSFSKEQEMVKIKAVKNTVEPSLTEIIFTYYVQDYIQNLSMSRNYRFIQIAVENIVIPLCIIVPFTNCYMQLALCLFFQVCMLGLTLWMRPNKMLINNIELCLQNSIWIAIFSLFLVLTSYIKSYNNFNNISKSEIDWLNSISITIMVCCLLLLFSSPIFIILKLILGLPKLIKLIKQKLSKSKEEDSKFNDTNQSQLNIPLDGKNNQSIHSPMMRSFKAKNVNANVNVKERLLEMREFSIQKSLTRRDIVLSSSPTKLSTTIAQSNFNNPINQNTSTQFQQNIKKIQNLMVKNKFNFQKINQQRSQQNLQLSLDTSQSSQQNKQKILNSQI